MRAQRIMMLPYHHRQLLRLPPTPATLDTGDFLLGRETLLLPLGRLGIRLILSSLGLVREDEVLISTSTDDSYVSSCVTCNVFNFCKPSRVLSPATRAVFILHEWGLPNPETEALVAEGRRRGIPVIEDCAHTLDSRLGGRLVGTFGDFTVYSWSKIFPMEHGGAVTGAVLPHWTGTPEEQRVVEVTKDELCRYASHLSFFTQRRRENFRYLQERFEDHQVLFSLDAPGGSEITPYLFPLLTSAAAAVRERHHEQVEWGPTHIADLLLVPVHPLLDNDDLDRMVRLIRDTEASTGRDERGSR